MIHISKISNKKIKHPKDVLSVGDVVKVKITDIDLENHRIGLSMINLSDDEDNLNLDEINSETTNSIEGIENSEGEISNENSESTETIEEVAAASDSDEE